MTALVFQPPPTWALPILVNEQTKVAQFNPIWLKWFVDLAHVLSGAGGGGGSIDHNMLTGLQEGTADEYYHLTAAQHSALGVAFPVGAIFVTVDPTNPNTTLGYGTWTQFGQGRVLVGLNPSDPDFDVVEETGGSKTQTFTV